MKCKWFFSILTLSFSCCMTLQADTISHWPMNGTGTAEVDDEVRDVVGDNHGFVINGDLEYVAGNEDSPSALLFEQSNQDKIEVLDSPSLHFDLETQSFTMESVFRVADNATGRPSPFAKNGSAAGDSQYWARVRADQTGGVQFLIRGDGGDGEGGDLPPERIATTNGSVTDGLWHHFAAVYTAGDDNVHLYLDYSLDTTFEVDPLDGIIGDNVGSLIIGGFTSSSREFGGEIADLRFSDAALTPEQFLPELQGGLRLTNVAGDLIDTVVLPSEVTNIVKGDPKLTEGLAQYWYDGNMRGNVEGFLEAGDTGSEAHPLVNEEPFASKTTWWAGTRDANVISDVQLPSYPDGLRGTRFDGSGNEDNYGVRLTGEIFFDSNGDYLLRDGMDDFAMIAIDQDGDGELNELADATSGDLGLGGFGDVMVLDDDWANLEGGNQTEANHGVAEISNIGADGDWRKIEVWMAEGGGGDGGIVYMGKVDDPDIFDETNGEALSQAERDAFVIRNDQLRSTVRVVESGDANAALRDDLEYVMQVTPDASDQFSVDDNEGVYTTTLDVTGTTIRLDLEGEIENGTSLTLFDADNVVGLDSLMMSLDDESTTNGWEFTLDGPNVTLTNANLSSCDVTTQGDLDGNGVVEFADFLVLSSNFGQEVDSARDGDIDCSGDVSFADFLVLSQNFGKAIGADVASVPEPSGLMLLATGVVALQLLRRRRG